jgi:ABC-type Zn uptake system ZnuABC Zn-binding protein ZnuA
MTRLTALVLSCTVLLATACVACGDDDAPNATDGTQSASDGRVKVVTSVAPITSLAENIVGTAADVEGIVPEGTSSHEYEPPPSIGGGHHLRQRVATGGADVRGGGG